MRNASRVRNSKATRMAGFIRGRVILKKRCVAEAPSTRAARSKSSGTKVSPARSNRAMKGVVFQISVKMMTRNADQRSVSQAWSSPSRALTKPMVGSKANFHASAATTVMMP